MVEGDRGVKLTKTTYILCGGAERWVGNFGSYLQNFFAGRQDELKILDVFFASVLSLTRAILADSALPRRAS
jgi:hypothetical protein